MIDFEKLLLRCISMRCNNLRKNKYQTIPPELIAYGQKSAILRIEKGRNTNSGNFISDSLLSSYTQYFSLSKCEMIFGTEENIENCLHDTFQEIYMTIFLKEYIGSANFLVNDGHIDNEVQEAFIKLTYTFGDFGRWYDIRRHQLTGDQEEFYKEVIDVFSMYKILWRLCKQMIIDSFKKNVIAPTLNDIDNRFHFNRINEKFNKWLVDDFARDIVTKMIMKLKNNSIFKIGFMVKNLIDEFLVQEFPLSYLEKIPLEISCPPIKNFLIDLDKDRSIDDLEPIAEALLNLHRAKQKVLTMEELKKVDETNFFEAIDGVIDKSTPLINDTRVINAESFLDHVMNSPDFFDDIHELNRTEQKIPGILTVNSHASNLLQLKISTIVEQMVNDLVRYQNIFINCIKWEELEDFAK